MYSKKASRVIQKVRERPLIFFALLHAVLFLAVSANLDQSVGNCGIERQLAVKILDGQVPYSNFFSEYPPLAILSFLLPALLSATQPAYGFLFALEIFLLDLVVLFILAKLASRLKMQVWRVLGIYTICLLAMGPIVTGRFDLLPAALVMLALYAFISGRNKIAWAVLALGATAKLYPLVIVPLFALYLLRHRRYRQLIQGIAVFGGAVLALNLPWIIINADGFWQFLSYHMERGLHSESSYASVLLVGQMLGLTQVDATLTYGSWNISSPMANALYQASFYVTAGFLLLAYALYARRLWKKLATTVETEIFSSESIELILRYSLLAVFAMLLTSKVLSPQFLIWLCPLIPLVKGQWRYVPLVLFMVVGGITQYIYPHNYIEFELATVGFELGKPYLIVLLFIRNLLMLAMAIVYILPLRISYSDREGEPGIDGNNVTV